MIKFGVYVDEIQHWNINSIISSARFHDVGKIYIPESILNKSGKLTEEEFETVKTHTIEGAKIIDQAISITGGAGFLKSAKLVAVYHHERWDGAGYPYGLREAAIPLHGRLMAVIDVYDALVSRRSYKEPFTHNEAVSIIRDSAGKHFDPLIAGVFCEISNQFQPAN